MSPTRYSSFPGIAAFTVSAICLLGIVPAANAADETEANAAASLIEELAPDQGSVSEDGFAHIPETGEQVLTSNTPGVASEVRSSSGEILLEVPLPEETDSQQPSQAVDGTDVYIDQGSSLDVAVQVMDDGATRVQTILNSQDSPTEITYPIPEGFSPARAEDGSAWLISEDGFVMIDAPWAIDASGVPMSTYYEVTDDAIIQHVVVTEDTSFPVIADPRFEWYNAAYGMGLSKKETKKLASYSSVTGFCAALVKWGATAVFCGLYGSYLFLRAQQEANRKKCLFIVFAPVPGAALSYSGGGCK